ncbi:MAG: hypothetical protein R6U31_01555 [bacterium]
MRKLIIIMVLPVLIVAGILEGISSSGDDINKFYGVMDSIRPYTNRELLLRSDITQHDMVKMMEVLTYGQYRSVVETHTGEMLSLDRKELYPGLKRMKSDNYIEHFIKIKSFFEDGDYDSAHAYISLIREMDEHRLDSVMDITEAVILYSEGYYDSSIAIAGSNNDDYSLYIRAIDNYRQGNIDSALVLLRSVSNKQIMPSKYILVTEMFLSKREYNNALDYADLFINNYQQSAEFYYVLYMKGDILYKKGYFRKSIDELMTVAEKSKNSILKGNAYYLIGKNYFMLGDYSNMEKYLSYVKNPLIPSDYERNAQFLDGKGMFFDGKYSKSIEKLEHFIDEYPDDFLTPYAYQILAQSYFYLEEYDNALKYINSIENPEFVVDKLIQMKYFIDYKNGVYPDSITAWKEFLENEKNNPLRNEVYLQILNNTDDNAEKLDYLKQYIDEFPSDKATPQLFAQLIDYIVFYEHFDELYYIMDRFARQFPDMKSAFIEKIITKMYELEIYERIVDFYTRYSREGEDDNPEVLFPVTKALFKMINPEGAVILIENTIENMPHNENEYIDSMFIVLSDYYKESGKIDELDDLIEQTSLQEDNSLRAHLLLRKGILLRKLKNYEASVNILIRGAELFGEQRDNAAELLIEASRSAYLNNDSEYARMLLERAELLAARTDLLNRIKVEYERIKQ